MSEKLVCPECKGEKKITLTVHWPGKEPEESVIDCVTCDGNGVVTQEEYDDYLEEEAMWCECDDNPVPVYYADDEHPDLYKHHWRCPNCEGVVQIG